MRTWNFDQLSPFLEMSFPKPAAWMATLLFATLGVTRTCRGNARGGGISPKKCRMVSWRATSGRAPHLKRA